MAPVGAGRHRAARRILSVTANEVPRRAFPRRSGKMMNDVNLLQTFLAVYRAGSMTGAAQLLNMSQPAVTAHIKNLERQLGTQLFVRIPRSGVQPTLAAKSLADRVAPHLDALADKGLLEPTATEQPVTITGPADLLASFVAPAVSPLIAEGVRIHATADATPSTFKKVAATEIDMAVTLGCISHRDLRVTKLADSEIALVGAPRWAEFLNHTVIQRDGIAALSSVPVLSYSEDLQVMKVYFGELFGSSPEVESALVFNDLRALASAVRHGAGITVLPVHYVLDDLQEGRVVELHRPERRPSKPIVVAVNATNSDPRLSPIIEALRAYVLEHSEPNPRAVA